MRFIILIAFSLIIASNALAQVRWPRRSIHPQVPLVFTNPPEIGHSDVLERNGILCIDEVVPPNWVSVNAPVPRRIQPKETAGLDAGTELYVANTSRGVVHCQPLDQSMINPRSQCMVDMNADSHFDGGYVANGRTKDSQYTPVKLETLRTLDYPIPYSEIPRPDGFSEPARIQFRRFSDGLPTFRVTIAGERLTTEPTCTPITETTCDILGIIIDWERSGNSLVFEVVDVAPQRGMELNIFGGATVYVGLFRNPMGEEIRPLTLPDHEP